MREENEGGGKEETNNGKRGRKKEGEKRGDGEIRIKKRVRRRRS